MIDQARLQELLNYDPETGVFTWKCRTNGRMKADGRAGYTAPGSYTRINVGGEKHLAHRLAWLYVYGAYPAGEIDHINGYKADNRIANLRAATKAENQFNTGVRRNNSSGYKGVYLNRATGRWMAIARLNPHRINLGSFATAEEAHIAYIAFAYEHHGEFTRAA